MNIDHIASQRASDAYTDSTLRQPATPAGAPTPAATPTASASTPAAPALASTAGATIKLSPEARLFAHALASAQATPDVRADRVAAARARVARGDAGDVTALANKLLGQAEQ